MAKRRPRRRDPEEREREHALVRRAKRVGPVGREAFAELIALHGDAVIGFLHRRLGQPDLARDLAQDTFLRAFQAIDRYEPKAPFRAWLVTIARNLLTDHFRRSGREEDPPLPEPPPGPLGRTIQAEEAARVRAAVHQLPPIYRDVVILRVWQELPYVEVSEILGCSVGAAKVRMHKATKLLKKTLEGR